MFVDAFRFGRRLPLILLCLVTMVPVFALPPAVFAAAENIAAKDTVVKSLEAIWTGKQFDARLKEGQQELKKMLKAGTLGRTDLREAIKTSALPMMERCVTSRYILRTAPERFNSVFAPYMKWEEALGLIWKAGLSKAKSSAPMLITVGTLAPSGTPWINVPETVTKPRIAKLSGGKVLIKIYTGGVMGEDTDILRKMDIGQLDGCGCTALGILAACPDVSVFLAPGLFKSYDEVDYIYKKFRKRIDKAFEKRNYIPVAMLDTGFFYIFSKNRITSLADVRKQKILTWFGIVETTLDNELGIKPTPVAVPEVVSALSSGLADTNISPPTWMLGMQAYQYSNYYLKPPLLYSPAAVVVSTRTRDRLQKKMGFSDALADNFMELVIHEFNVDEQYWRNQVRAYEAKCLKAFETKCGMKAITLSPADQAMIKKAAIATREKLAGKSYSKDFLNDILKALDEYRKTKH